MGMALLRMKKGKGRGAPPPAAAKGEAALLPEPALPLPARSSRMAAHPHQGPVVHIHIGPTAAHPDEAESAEEAMRESPADEVAEGAPPPLLLRALHDKIQAARAAGRK